jgi:hypothetical protein
MARKVMPFSDKAVVVGQAANATGQMQAMLTAASQVEAIEGLLLAAETAMLVQIAIGGLTRRQAARLRRAAARWGRKTARCMERDGRAEDLRRRSLELVEEHRKALEAACERTKGDANGPN